MSYNVDTVVQLRAVMKALRKIRELSQTDLGRIIGVNQKRIAKIEAAPGVTSWDQIAQIIAALGGRIAIEDTGDPAVAAKATKPPPGGAKAARQSKRQTSW
ncbi:MAG: helix-turn-helix domain-containing protein [Opitutaceae bacterium]|jgi:HTH-type transcriptional regulator/antitoxin HipB